jgi:hypothetical protein
MNLFMVVSRGNLGHKGSISPENLILKPLKQVQLGEKNAGARTEQSLLYFFTEKGVLG